MTYAKDDCIYTAEQVRRVAQVAFAEARKRKSGLVNIHKANVLRISDGLFLSEVRKVAARYPQIAHEEILVDAAAAHLVRDPARFDVILATNMFGDILSDLASEIAGGLGLGASLNLGAHAAVAQAQHGSAPDIAGQDRANPSSLIGSAAMLLRHLGATDAANAIDTALDAALSRPETRTPDLGGALGTAAFGARLATGQGVMHLAQDADAVARLARPLSDASAFQLAALHDLIAISAAMK